MAWLRWETSVGNQDRPTLGAPNVRRDRLEQDAGGDTGRLTPTHQGIQALTDEIDQREMQYQQAIETEQAAAQRTVIVSQRGPEPPGRNRGPELGM